MILAQERAHQQQAVERVDLRHRHAEPARADARSIGREVALPQPVIDVVAAEPAHQAAEQEQFFQRGVGRSQRADRGRAVLRLDLRERVHHVIDRIGPIDLAPLPALLEHRPRQAVGRIQALVRKAVAIRQPALVDRLVLQRQHAQHLVVLHLDDDVAAERVVAGHAAAARQFPGAGGIAERLRGQRADRAQVDHVARQFVVDGLVDERQDLGVLAAPGHAEFHLAGDLLTEAHAARAVDAARHLLGRDQRAETLVEHDALGLVVAAGRAAVAHGQILQLALAALIADRAVERMVDQQELHHRLLGLLGLVGSGANDHALRDRRGAGRQRLRRLLHFDQAHPAVGRDAELLVVAEVRHVDVELGRGVHHHAAGADLDLPAVNLDFDHGDDARRIPAPGSARARCDARTPSGSA